MSRKQYTIPKQARAKWADSEHDLFMQGIQEFGRQWKYVAGIVKTKTVSQVRSHAQKTFANLLAKGQSHLIPPPIITPTKKRKSPDQDDDAASDSSWTPSSLTLRAAPVSSSLAPPAPKKPKNKTTTTRASLDFVPPMGWTRDDIVKFYEGIERFGRNWQAVATHMGSHKSVHDIRHYAYLTLYEFKTPAETPTLGPWTYAERARFTAAYRMFGRDIYRIAEWVGPTKTYKQVRNYALCIVNIHETE